MMSYNLRQVAGLRMLWHIRIIGNHVSLVCFMLPLETHAVSYPQQVLALLAGGQVHYLFLGLFRKCWLRFLHNSHIGLQRGKLDQIASNCVYILGVASVEGLQGIQCPHLIGRTSQMFCMVLVGS